MAEAWLESPCDQGVLTVQEETPATAELRGLFELFENDDFLDMFAE